MKSDEKMFSVDEIIRSRKFKREVSENFPFAVRQALRRKQLKETEQTQNVNQNKKKNINLAK